MQLTTEQRFEKTLKFIRRKKFTRSCEVSSTFRATPHIVLFQSCEPGRTYSLLLNIQNTVQVSQVHLLKQIILDCVECVYTLSLIHI